MLRLTARAVNGVLLPAGGLASISILTEDSGPFGTWAAFFKLGDGSGHTATGTIEGTTTPPVITLKKPDGTTYASGPISERIAILTGSDGSVYTCTVDTLAAA